MELVRGVGGRAWAAVRRCNVQLRGQGGLRAPQLLSPRTKAT